MNSDFDPIDIVDALRECLSGGEPIALHEPEFGGQEWTNVKSCLDSGWVSSAGDWVDEFGERIADYVGTDHAIPVVTGTAALHAALRIVGVERGEEVLVPTLTFVATANAVSYLGAVPHLVDSDGANLGIDAEKLNDHLMRTAEMRDGACVNAETGRTISAVVPMHTFGHPVDLDPLEQVCDKYGLSLVEDAAESLGSRYKGEHTGTRGQCAALSFNGNKIITTGGGGALLTDDDRLADQARHLTQVAKEDHPWAYRHDQTGYNYRMPNLNAALGCAQLEQLDSYVDRKRSLARRYSDALRAVDGVQFVEEPQYARSNYWLNAFLLEERYAGYRDEVLDLSNEEGLCTRPTWTPMHELPMYEECPRMDLSQAEDVHSRLITIPSSPGLTKT